MMFLDALRGMTGSGTGRTTARLRLARRRGRQVVAALLGPVVAAASCLVPVTVTAVATAAITVSAVAAAGPAKAASDPPVLVVLVNGETTAPETALLTGAGYAVTQVTPATLESMSQPMFQGYAAVVVGDPSVGGTCPASWQPTTATLGTNWEGWVTGNVAVLGTAPAAAGSSAADTLITDTARYAAAQPGSAVTRTGLYLSLDCGYSTAAKGTAVPVLNGVEGIGTAGGVSVNGSLSCADAGTVNKWEAAAAGTLSGFTSASLAAGAPGWPSPACPVQETFDSWPAMFTPLAYDAAGDAAPDFTASDGTAGQPYILLGAPVSSATQALAPSTGGEVPAGTTSGGTSNPAAPGVSQATAGDPVNTETGDFTQSDTDLSIPTYGPALSFTRTYDSGVAQQQTQTGAPGAMGYGWTDNWASSLTPARPVSGDIYTLDGMRTDNGTGGPPAASALGDPGGVVSNGGNMYFADTSGNRVLEVPGTTGTQWGQPMTAGDTYVVAGNGIDGQWSVLVHPQAIAFDSAGDMYISDTWDNRVEEIPVTTKTQWGVSMTADVMTTIAGNPNGVSGTAGDGGPATSAYLYSPGGLAFDPAGNLYIADTANNRVQEVAAVTGAQWGQPMTAADVYTISGAAWGSSGDGGPASAADLDGPASLTIDSAGDVILADSGNNRIQEIAKATGTQWGQPMTAGDIYTIAGSATGTAGTTGDGGAAASALLDGPQAVLWASPNLYVADALNNRVQEIAGSTGTQWGQPVTAGDIYTIAGSAAGTAGFSGDGGAATAATLNNPLSLTLDGSADLYIADADNNRVREVNASTAAISTYAGNGYTLATAGDGGPATQAALNNPMQEAFDSHGDTYIADAGNNRIQEIAAYTHTQYGISMTAGDVYTIAGQADGQAGCQCDGGPATQAYLNDPWGITIDAAGDLYIADSGNNRIQEVPAANGTQWGQPMTAGDMYTIAGNQYGTGGSSGDGGPASQALLDNPIALTMDPGGDIYIADSWNSRVQEIAGATGTQWGQPMTAGDIYTIAGSATGAHGSTGDGGPATSALLYGAGGLALDSSGDLYIGDGGNNRVQELAAATHTQWGQSMTADDIYTVTGTGYGYAGDGGPASAAQLGGAPSLAIDASGDLYIADEQNNRIQEIANVTGTQWGQSMTAGDEYTVAGSATGVSGNSGDGGPATSALLANIRSVSLDPENDLYITDNANDTVREVASATANAIAPAPGQTSALVIAPAGTAPAGLTITQPGGAQVTFWAQQNGGCATSYVTSGSYCVLPQDQGATLSYNSGNQDYIFSPAPGSLSYTYRLSGATAPLTSETDTAGSTLTITASSPAPGGTVTGNGTCPSTAVSCQTITSASGRALILGYSGASDTGQVTSVTDPMNRTWTYGYTGSDLTSVTDPMTNKTTYTYGPGSTGNPLLANDLLTITRPNGQPGGPDAGDATVNAYDNLGRVTSQTDPMGWITTFSYCANPAAGDCMNSATGTGLVTVTDPDGNQTVYDYDQGTLAAQSIWTKTTTGLTLTSEQDSVPDTTAASTSNPSGGTLADTSSTDGDGNTTTSSYDADGNPTSAASPGANGTPATTTAVYTATLQLANCESSALAAATATCQQDDPPAPVAPGGVITPPSSAPSEGVTYTLYDTDGNELYTTTGVYEPGATTAAYAQTTYQLFTGNSLTLNGKTITCSLTPPSPSLPCAQINADGVVTQLGYDSAGDLTSSSIPDGNGSQLATATYAYNGDGEQTSTTDPDGNLSGANPGNYTTVTAYNADGQQSTVTQAGGSGATVTPRTTTYGYDANGNTVTVQDARGYTTTTTYNTDNNATLVTDPDGNATLTCYNGDDDTAQTVPPVDVANSNLTAASCPTSYPSGYSTRLAPDATVSTYNALGEITQKTTPAPAGQSTFETTSYAYDGNGNLTQTTAPPTSNGGPAQVTVDTYNSAGQPASQTTGYGTPAASTFTYCYDPAGDRTAIVAPDGNASGTAPCQAASPWTVSALSNPTQAAYQTTYSYDSIGEQASVTTPATTAALEGATASLTYDPAGNPITSTDPDGVTTTKTYTPEDLTATVSYSGSAAHTVTYSYDANGVRTGMTDGTGTSSYIYDPFGELTSQTNGAGQITGYGYDPAGNLTSISYPLPATATWAKTSTVSYGYDNADELTSVTDFAGNKITITNTPDGLPSSQVLGATGDTVTTSYDNTDSASAITLANSSTTLQSFTYTDAPCGDILTETDTPTSGTTPATYTYDAQGRVTSMSLGTGPAASYGFDPSGDLTALPGGATGTYDHDGELTTATTTATTTAYTYDADGQRLSATRGSTTVESATWNGAGELTAYSDGSGDMTSAAYDGDGLRASSSTNSGGTQEYTWNSVAPVPELLTDSTNAYIYTGATAPAEQVNLTNGNVTYLITDSLGSVRGTVGPGGNLTGTSNYDAWGNPEGSSGITAITPFGYAGGYTDTTGLIYLINRYYDPATAQFISLDPLLAQTLQPYAYADGDPVNATDPSGESLPPAGGSHDPCGVSQSSCNPSSNPGSNGGVTKYQPKHAKPKKYEPQHAREHKDCHQNEWGWGYCHWSLNEAATEYTITVLESVIDGDESADAAISMLPDVIGVVLGIAGVALTYVKNEMERNDELSEHHGVYFHVYMLTFYVPYWFRVHPNGL